MEDIKHHIFCKLAFARFEAKLEENGVNSFLVKQALSEGEKIKKSLEKSKGLKGTLKHFKEHLTRGTYATEASKAKGLKAMGARGFNRLFAGLTAADVIGAATRKRKKGEGFFESAGRRTGRAATSLSMYTPGRAGAILGGITLGSIAGLPSLGDIGGKAGKAVDVGLSKARKAGKKIRSIFGGGKSFKQKKLEALNKAKKTKRPKAKLNMANRFNMKADYQK